MWYEITSPFSNCNNGDIAKDMCGSALILGGSACSYKQGTFLDLYTCVIDGNFVTDIYHKIDEFNFEVINYPFPQSNINSMLCYKTFIHNPFVSLDFVIISMISILPVGSTFYFEQTYPPLWN